MELHVIRTHIMMYMILLIISIVVNKWLFSIIFVALIVLLTLSGCKVNNYINKIKHEYRDKKEELISSDN